MKPVRVAPQAAQELAEAAVWYESRRTGLSARLLSEVKHTQQLIGDRPASFSMLKGRWKLEIRRALLPRFPYAVVFLEFESHIQILAFAHLKRRPGYWLRRLEP